MGRSFWTAALLGVAAGLPAAAAVPAYMTAADHADAAGWGTRDTNTLHRIDPASVKHEALAAGFTFAGESKVLRNAADDHGKPVFDPAIKGHTDQFILKFRKPA